MTVLRPFTDEQCRVLLNVGHHYDAWIDVCRRLAVLGAGAAGHGTRAWETMRDGAWERLEETCRIYGALRLPRLHDMTAERLREADLDTRVGLRRPTLGDEALSVYCVEAGGRIEGLTGLDLAWEGVTDDDVEMPDGAVGDWLLEGRSISHVLVACDGSPASVRVPDPRRFALWRMWSGGEDGARFTQGTRILEAVAETMPHLHLDVRFEETLPQELAPVFARWREGHEAPAPRFRSW